MSSQNQSQSQTKSKSQSKSKTGAKRTNYSEKRRRSRKEVWSRYVYKVLKQIHPNTGISNCTMEVMNNFLNDVFERIASEAARLAKMNHRQTLTEKEIATATKLVLGGELAKHGERQGQKAVDKFYGASS